MVQSKTVILFSRILFVNFDTLVYWILKMGIRQHGDGIDELKRLRFVSKCERTTSKKYGVRVAGMQYYDASNSMYQCVNKYYGESLSFLQMRNFCMNFSALHPDLIVRSYCSKAFMTNLFNYIRHYQKRKVADCSVLLS
uniref:Kinase n=1 Tax=Parascaris univalens TaxID=6257 RepID=A0A914ZMQ7_PARUN